MSVIDLFRFYRRPRGPSSFSTVDNFYNIAYCEGGTTVIPCEYMENIITGFALATVLWCGLILIWWLIHPE